MGVRVRVRTRVPRIPEAAGDDWGTVSGSGEPLRLAVLGDSSAAGVGAPDHRSALAGQLAEALAALTGRALSWRVVARSGATARAVRRDLVDQLTDPHRRWSPQVVVVVVGINDTIRLRRPGQFRRQVEQLVAAIRHRVGAPVPVLLAGLPPVHRFPALPAPARLLFGTHARRLDRQLARLAHRDDTVFHLPVGNLPVDRDDFYAPDGFHPAPAAYRLWGQLLGAQAAAVVEAIPARPAPQRSS